MARSFDMSADYAGSVEAVLGAFADERYWLARLAQSGADEALLEELAVSPSGAVTVATTQVLYRDKLPGVVAQFHRGNLRITRREQWEPIADGRSAATVSGAVPGAPVTLTGDARLQPATTADASRATLRLAVEVRVPLVGGKIEEMLGGRLRELIRIEGDFTNGWIAGPH
ncbi:DUF2505 domain-containing protein [Mycolicibacterium fallax]|jgi:hypothetical protein|uniref:Uncharacterized protein n=1 Tax=Mycolicibacterium fallax TaxID=1793 RepID=A0A1X1RD20_MYCFA|nr:DUF2505 domain-containing protein [Mycolicibacterium fallax]ORV03205.1 hypothetical protein AWC04_11305 [Mycolicibacterium fallax]BBY98785.1 hypothetical protein MFAL_22520 [Mycolicibacterium fallax]HOW94088.1 DUF2505 domain-containing protein [Mycolicibacterium fallax]HSA41081.1 DUF2505 domain-containing protein [Mycobacterium sp.]